jgi:hypothetical protein
MICYAYQLRSVEPIRGCAQQRFKSAEYSWIEDDKMHRNNMQVFYILSCVVLAGAFTQSIAYSSETDTQLNGRCNKQAPRLFHC